MSPEDLDAERNKKADAAAESEKTARTDTTASATGASEADIGASSKLSKNAQDELEKAKSGNVPKANMESSKKNPFKFKDVKEENMQSLLGRILQKYLKGASYFTPLIAALVLNPICVVGGVVSGVGSCANGVGLGMAGLTLGGAAIAARKVGAEDFSKKLEVNSKNAFKLCLEAERSGLLDIARTPRNLVNMVARIPIEILGGYFSTKLCGLAESPALRFYGTAEKMHLQILNTTWEGKDANGQPNGKHHQGNPHSQVLLMAHKKALEDLDKSGKNSMHGSSKVVPSSDTVSGGSEKSNTSDNPTPDAVSEDSLVLSPSAPVDSATKNEPVKTAARSVVAAPVLALQKQGESAAPAVNPQAPSMPFNAKQKISSGSINRFSKVAHMFGFTDVKALKQRNEHGKRVPGMTLLQTARARVSNQTSLRATAAAPSASVSNTAQKDSSLELRRTVAPSG